VLLPTSRERDSLLLLSWARSSSTAFSSSRRAYRNYSSQTVFSFLAQKRSAEREGVHPEAVYWWTSLGDSSGGCGGLSIGGDAQIPSRVWQMYPDCDIVLNGSMLRDPRRHEVAHLAGPDQGGAFHVDVFGAVAFGQHGFDRAFDSPRFVLQCQRIAEQHRYTENGG
jgi:hypothetical protein